MNFSLTLPPEFYPKLRPPFANIFPLETKGKTLGVVSRKNHVIGNDTERVVNIGMGTTEGIHRV